MKTTSLTADEVRNCTWTVTGQDEHYRYSIGRGTHPVTGMPIEVLRKEFLADEEMQALNTEERAIRDTKRWSQGDGSEKGGNMPLIHVGRVPLAKWFADFRDKAKEGDKDFHKWQWNREDYAPFRTRSGKL